ncbi:hypothetical protein [Luteipulveratus mongoliensis]|uniref:Uncharacterized protein n=1 Tax=Luteipulveratus mongoliensis TaxID=571913 RepID=A0A0K1JJU2_9MICO|nr:hypothetical protein [Luteipulveratus mongoliensis]AKU16840.1 hypothetical protein VV02_14800 [Luteipulveratus mongoliensis]
MTRDPLTLLQNTEPDAMEVDSTVVMRRGRQLRRRRRAGAATVGAGAAAVVGAVALSLTWNGSTTRPGLSGASSPTSSSDWSGSWSFFEDDPTTPAGDVAMDLAGRRTVYRIGHSDAGYTAARMTDVGATPLPLSVRGPGGTMVFKDGSLTVLVAPIPGDTSNALDFFTPEPKDMPTTGESRGVKLGDGSAAYVSATSHPIDQVRAVTWQTRAGTLGSLLSSERAVSATGVLAFASSSGSTWGLFAPSYAGAAGAIAPMNECRSENVEPLNGGMIIEPTGAPSARATYAGGTRVFRVACVVPHGASGLRVTASDAARPYAHHEVKPIAGTSWDLVMVSGEIPLKGTERRFGPDKDVTEVSYLDSNDQRVYRSLANA